MLLLSVIGEPNVHILNVDESGDPTNPANEHFVLAGMAAFERQTHWLSQQLDALEIELFGAPDATSPPPFRRPVEFHASAIHARRIPPWDGMTAKQSKDILRRLSGVVADSHDTCALFGVVVHRPSYPTDDPVMLAFNELTSRFDLFLARMHAQGNTQRGLLVFDKSRHEQRLQTVLRSYTTEGGPFGRVRNFSDVPFFADSRASRMLQLADFVAWTTFRRYEAGAANHFDEIVTRFDTEGTKIHGLQHRTKDYATCACLACFSRRMSKLA
jgi:hypothetical protein